MDERIINFLTKNRIGVLTTLLQDGTPHSSTVHYASTNDKIVVLTEKESRKCQNLSDSPTQASFVVGFSEEEWITLQMEGEVVMKPALNDSDSREIYEAKFKSKLNLDENDVFLIFTTKWQRYKELKRE